jgi:DNA-binding phage protein
MPKRSEHWNEGLAEDLKDFEFAREFILSASEEGLSIQRVLAKVIGLYGIKEFSEVCGMESPNILRAVDSKSNPTQRTLNKLLEPFGLALGPVVRPQRKRKGKVKEGGRVSKPGNPGR